MWVAPKRDKLHFNDLQYIYICMYASHTYASVKGTLAQVWKSPNMF